MTSVVLIIYLISLSFPSFGQEILQTRDAITKALCAWNCLKESWSKVYCEEFSICSVCKNTTIKDYEVQKKIISAPQLVCKETNKLGLYLNNTRNFIYVVEIMSSEKNMEWTFLKMIYCNRFSIERLKLSSTYKVRVWGVSDTKEVYRSKSTKWLKFADHSFKKLKAPPLHFSEFLLNSNNTISTTVVWNQTEDLPCSYSFFSYGDSSCQYTRDIKYPTETFQYKFTDIKMNGHCDICIEILNISGSLNCVSTPSCLETFKTADVCAPLEPVLLDVKEKLLFCEGNNSDECYYNITIIWESPEYEPDYYRIAIEDLVEGNVTRNETEFTFTNVPFRSSYNVEITAYSRGGNSTTFNEISITLPLQKSWIVYVISGVIASLAVVAFLVHLLHHYCQQIKLKRRKEEATADFHEHRKSISGIYTINRYDYEQPIMEYSDKWWLDPENLTIAQMLGEGAFGIVRKGYLYKNSETLPVAIKMLKDCPSSSDLKEFQQEIEIMKTVGSHPHLVSLIGICTWKQRNKLLLVVEFCEKGDLQSYLRSIWRKLNGQSLKIDDYRHFCYVNNEEVSNKLYEIEDEINSQSILRSVDLLSFARQIALGMEYLSSLRLLHRDLATRNVLVCENNCVKVADFGLSRDVYQNNVYCKSGGGKLPLKWMAIESLTHQQYTTQSDVWSYGILLWEIVTLGGFPYPDVATSNLLKYLENGYRMARPDNCSEELYKLMRSCWETNPKDRPNFSEIVKYLDSLLENETEYIKLDN